MNICNIGGHRSLTSVVTATLTVFKSVITVLSPNSSRINISNGSGGYGRLPQKTRFLNRNNNVRQQCKHLPDTRNSDIAAPVEVPMIQSNNSVIFFPDAISKARSNCTITNPRIPPPSSDRTRRPLGPTFHFLDFLTPC
ncbi:unnamed protein product [Schistosoma margrebowiei]|uniref:Uncharacterized protein n=1 Tax=Schistosoma margrebowiei TaxID=48269 RepID=A0A3P8E2J3_9TREM|nr:unnamed protein product [Schistosoma margrebowiei]